MDTQEGAAAAPEGAVCCQHVWQGDKPTAEEGEQMFQALWDSCKLGAPVGTGGTRIEPGADVVGIATVLFRDGLHIHVPVRHDEYDELGRDIEEVAFAYRRDHAPPPRSAAGRLAAAKEGT